MGFGTNIMVSDGGGSSKKKKTPTLSVEQSALKQAGAVIRQNNANEWLSTQGKYTPVTGTAPVLYNPVKGLYENVGVSGNNGNTATKASSGSANSGATPAGGYAYNPQAYQGTYTPGTYTSKYGANIEALLSQIQNRKFSYDMNADPLYQQYKDQYIRGGNLAMRDAAAQAAALTGGYGSSYATTAASQAYDNYLAGLNDKAIDLYNAAADRYNSETNDLYNQLGAYNDLEQQNYNQWRDAEDAAFQADQVNYSRWNDYQSALRSAAAQAAQYQNAVSSANSGRTADVETVSLTDQDYTDISEAASNAYSEMRRIMAQQEEMGREMSFSKQDVINYLNAMYLNYSGEKKSQIANALVDRLQALQ